MPSLDVRYSSSQWQYKGDADSSWTNFATNSSQPATLNFSSTGNLNVVGKHGGGCSTNTITYDPSTSITSEGTGYSVAAQCGSGTRYTGYFSAGRIDDVDP